VRLAGEAGLAEREEHAERRRLVGREHALDSPESAWRDASRFSLAFSAVSVVAPPYWESLASFTSACAWMEATKPFSRLAVLADPSWYRRRTTLPLPTRVASASPAVLPAARCRSRRS